MSSSRHRSGATAPRVRSTSIGMLLVGVVAGLLFATNASLFSASADERRPSNLRDLVRAETERLAETNAEVTALQAEVNALLEDEADPAAIDPGLLFAAGRVAVAGPGIEVQLWDAPIPSQLPDGVRPDDLVVHQRDLEAVINGLWAGGAEAMTVQGHRVTPMTQIRCVGNVLLIDGATYSPPYVIAAIGDPEQLEVTLLAMRPIRIYLEWVEAVGLGWSLEEQSEIEMAADEGNLSLDYASEPGQDLIDIDPRDLGVPDGSE